MPTYHKQLTGEINSKKKKIGEIHVTSNLIIMQYVWDYLSWLWFCCNVSNWDCLMMQTLGFLLAWITRTGILNTRYSSFCFFISRNLHSICCSHCQLLCLCFLYCTLGCCHSDYMMSLWHFVSFCGYFSDWLHDVTWTHKLKVAILSTFYYATGTSSFRGYHCVF